MHNHDVEINFTHMVDKKMRQVYYRIHASTAEEPNTMRRACYNRGVVRCESRSRFQLTVNLVLVANQASRPCSTRTAELSYQLPTVCLVLRRGVTGYHQHPALQVFRQDQHI